MYRLDSSDFRWIQKPHKIIEETISTENKRADRRIYSKKSQSAIAIEYLFDALITNIKLWS